MKSLIVATIFVFFFASTSPAQAIKLGGVTGKVRLVNGDELAAVTVEARQEDRIVAQTRTDKQGNFTINNLAPGVYKFVFNKKGLSEGTSPNITIKSGTILTLKRLVMTVDQGALAIIRGSVFDSQGRSISNVKAEIFKIFGNNDARKINETYTSQSGEFVFRLPPDAAQYRFLITADNAEPVSKDYNVNEGAQIYYVSITLKRKE